MFGRRLMSKILFPKCIGGRGLELDISESGLRPLTNVFPQGVPGFHMPPLRGLYDLAHRRCGLGLTGAATLGVRRGPQTGNPGRKCLP